MNVVRNIIFQRICEGEAGEDCWTEENRKHMFSGRS